MKTILTLGALFGFLAVALGAFGAHALRERLTPEVLEVYKTGVQYQFYHVFAMIAVGLLMRFFPEAGLLRTSGWLFMVGIVIFSGSLYAYSLTGIKTFGAITPIGGLLFLAGWLTMGWAVWKFSIE